MNVDELRVFLRTALAPCFRRAQSIAVDGGAFGDGYAVFVRMGGLLDSDLLECSLRGPDEETTCANVVEWMRLTLDRRIRAQQVAVADALRKLTDDEDELTAMRETAVMLKRAP